MQVELRVDSAWFRLLMLKHDEPLSNFPFNLNFLPYDEGLRLSQEYVLIQERQPQLEEHHVHFTDDASSPDDASYSDDASYPYPAATEEDSYTYSAASDDAPYPYPGAGSGPWPPPTQLTDLEYAQSPQQQLAPVSPSPSPPPSRRPHSPPPVRRCRLNSVQSRVKAPGLSA